MTLKVNSRVWMGLVATLGMMLALQACCGNCNMEKVPVPEERADFIGHWEAAEGDTIDIMADGSANFKTVDGSASKSVSGGGVTFKGDLMTIGLMGLENTWTIDKAPYQEDGATLMVLSGETFSKD